MRLTARVRETLDSYDGERPGVTANLRQDSPLPPDAIACVGGIKR